MKLSSSRCVYWVVVLGVALLSGCSKREEALSTGQTIPSEKLPLYGYAGDTQYAVVRASALPYLYDNFKSVLNSQGLVKWDKRYDCNHFASLYIATAQVKYAVATWHSSTPSTTLALAEVWYRPQGGPSGHAIVAALTETGLVYIEPQDGSSLTLSPLELTTINLIKW